MFKTNLADTPRGNRNILIFKHPSFGYMIHFNSKFPLTTFFIHVTQNVSTYRTTLWILFGKFLNGNGNEWWGGEREVAGVKVYLLEKGTSEEMVILLLLLSMDTTPPPRLPALPLTLIRSCRNCSCKHTNTFAHRNTTTGEGKLECNIEFYVHISWNWTDNLQNNWTLALKCTMQNA